MVKNKNDPEIFYYCECGQHVKLRKKDNTWIHVGWKRMHEPYSWFLDRTNHPVKIAKKIIWENSAIPHEEALKLLC